MKFLMFLIALAMSGPPAAGSAQSVMPAAAASTAGADRVAVAKIVMDSVAELQQCALAADKTQTPGIRSFCRGAAHEAERTALDGMQLAQKIGASGDVKLTASPETPAVLDALTKQSGHDFDRAFLLRQIEDRVNDQDALRYASDVTANTAVKRYEESVLPATEKYLQLAESTLRGISRDEP